MSGMDEKRNPRKKAGIVVAVILLVLPVLYVASPAPEGSWQLVFGLGGCISAAIGVWINVRLVREYKGVMEKLALQRDDFGVVGPLRDEMVAFLQSHNRRFAICLTFVVVLSLALLMTWWF
jgi:hypothetical protein